MFKKACFLGFTEYEKKHVLNIYRIRITMCCNTTSKENTCPKNNSGKICETTRLVLTLLVHKLHLLHDNIIYPFKHQINVHLAEADFMKHLMKTTPCWRVYTCLNE